MTKCERVMSEKVKKHRKRKFLLWAGALLLAVALGLTFLFACSSSVDRESIRPADSKNILLVPPTDGSTPADYSALDNVGYIIGRLSMRDYYHTFSDGKVSARVGFIDANQDVLSTKDYKDGVLITSQWSVSHSMFVKSKAIQKFFGDGTAVVREAASADPDDWDWENGTTQWKDGEPSEILDTQQYEAKYGLWATEISDYVINEDTFLSATDPVYEDGVYTMTISLDPETSTYYYKNNMRTMGNLSTDPTFDSVSLTLRYTDDWTILSYQIEEIYDTVMGVTAKCTGNTLVTFSYDEADVDISAFDAYFKNYADAAPTGGASAERGVSEYLAEGFGFVLDGESSLGVTASVAGRVFDGTVLLNMSSMNLNSVRVLLGGADGLDLFVDAASGTLYVDYKDLTAKLALSDLMGLFGDDLSASLDTDALMEQVMGGTLVKDGADVTIQCDLSLLGLEIPLTFRFTESEEAVELVSLTASLDLSGYVSGLGAVELTVVRGETDASLPAFDTGAAVDLKPYVDEIAGIVTGKDYLLTADYADDSLGLTVDADIRVNAQSGLALAGTVKVTYAGIDLPLNIVYAEDTVYLSLYGVRISATMSEAEEAVSQLLALAGVELPASDAASLDVAALVSKILGMDFDRLIGGLSLTEESLALSVDLDELVAAFTSEEYGLGMLSAAYTKGAGFTAEAFGLRVGFSAASGEAIAAPDDAARYVSLSSVLEYVDTIVSIANADTISFELADLIVSVGAEQMHVSVEGAVWLQDGVQLRLDLQIGDEEIGLSYVGGDIRLSYGGYYMQFTKDEIENIAGSVSALLSENDGAFSVDLASILQLFGESGVDLAAFLESLELVAAEGGESLAFDLASLIGGASSTVRLIADAYGSGLSLSLAEGYTVDLFGVTVSSFRAIVEVPEEAAAPEAVGGTECANIFEFILRAYNAFADTDKLSLSLQYAAEGMSVDMKGAVQFADNAQDGNVVVNLTVEGVITAGESNYFMRATVVGPDAYIYFSTVGFDSDAVYYTDRVNTSAAPLRARFTVRSLFDTAADAMPLIVSLMGLDKNDLYYFTFVVDILGDSYTTINSDIFDTKSTQDWAELIIGIIREYAGTGEAEQAAAAANSGVSVSFDSSERALVVSGAGLNVSLAADPECAAPAAPAQAYTDYSSLSILVGVMMDSITTSQPVYDENGDPVLDSEGDPVLSADINSYYYLSGNVTGAFKVDLGLITIPINLAEIKIYVSVYIHEDFSVAVNLHLDIPQTTVLGVTALEEAKVYVTIEGGMVYMLRVSGGSETYRVTTLDNFFGDILSHLSYLLSFGDAISNVIPTSPEGTGSASSTDIGNVLTSYSYNAAAEGDWPQQWTIGLNLSSVTDDVLQSASITIGADANGTLDGLNFNASLPVLGNSGLNLGATLKYVNPGESMGDAQSVGDITQNIAATASALFSRAIAGTDWAETSFIEGRPSTVNYLAGGTLLDSQTLAYDTTTGALLTEPELPDLSGFGTGYTYRWEGEPANGVTDFEAVATPNVYTVTVRSEHPVSGFGLSYMDGGVYVYEIPYTYGTTLSLPVGTESTDVPGYEIDGFVGENGASLSEVKDILAPVTLTAVWKEIEYTVTYSVFGDIVGTQTYHYGDAIGVLESVEGYDEVEWESVSAVSGDMTVNAVYASVSVTLASDFAADGFTAGEGGYYREYTLSGDSADDFALSYALTREGYTQFGWWSNAGGGWQNVTSLAGCSGETVWTVWVNQTLTVNLTTVSKSGGSTWTFAGTYTAFDAGTMSAAIADAVGIESTANVWHTLHMRWGFSDRDDPLNDGEALSGANGSFNNSGMTSFYGISGKVYYGFTRVEATYTYNGLTATSSGSATKDY